MSISARPLSGQPFPMEDQQAEEWWVTDILPGNFKLLARYLNKLSPNVKRCLVPSKLQRTGVQLGHFSTPFHVSCPSYPLTMIDKNPP